MFSEYFSKLVRSAYVPRRHFIKSHDYIIMRHKWLLIFFYNSFFRAIIFRIACRIRNKGSMCNSFSNKLLNRLYLCQEAPFIEVKDSLQFFDQKIRKIDYGHETRNALVIRPFEKLVTKLKITKPSFLFLGYVVLAKEVRQSIRIAAYDILINIEINSSNGNSNSLQIRLPVGSKKHGVARQNIGDNWVDFSIDMDEYLAQTIELTISTHFRIDIFIVVMV